MQSRAFVAFVGVACVALAACKSSGNMGGFTGASGGSAGSGTGSGGAGGAVTGSGGSGGSGVVDGSSDLGGAPNGTLASSGCGMTAPTPSAMIGTSQYGKFALTVAGQPAGSADRLYYVRTPNNYDPTKPYRVIYLGPGCGQAQDTLTSPKALPMDTDPNSAGATTDAILVQLEQGFYNPAEYNPADCRPGNTVGCNTTSAYCFDDWAYLSTIPDGVNGVVAIEKAYFDALHKTIEANYCVDKNRQFYGGYSSGGWLAQQLGCWFPEVLRAQANVTGGLPPPIKANLAYCQQDHKIAGMLIHNNPDVSNAFQGSVDSASRLFTLNGCTGTFVMPPLPNSMTALPDGLEEYTITAAPNTSSFRCYNYTTCPADYPIVFCVSTDSGHQDQHTRADPGFWQFFSKF
jgi:hypothetical protein